jgi:hypothetical protein
MIAEEDVVNKLVKTRRLIQEQDIETIPSKHGMRLQRHLISFELKNTYVGIMPFLYPYIFVDMCSYYLF